MSSEYPAGAVPFRSFERLRAETYTDVAAAALLIWDYFLTVNLEASLIWPSEWSYVKGLFMLTRYLPFVDVTLVLYYQLKPDISAETCKLTYRPAGWFIVFGIIIAEIILVVRTWAIWGRGKRVGYTLLAASIFAVVPVLIIENIFLKSIVFSPHPGPATPGCLLTSANPVIALSFVIVIIFETFVLVLTLIKGVQQYRVSGNRTFIAVLYRDGILFYCYLFGVSLINLIVIIAAPRDLANILAILQRVLHSCLSARVLIHLRQARQRESEMSSTLNSTPLRHLTFRQTEVSEDLTTSSGVGMDDQVFDIS